MLEKHEGEDTSGESILSGFGSSCGSSTDETSDQEEFIGELTRQMAENMLQEDDENSTISHLDKPKPSQFHSNHVVQNNKGKKCRQQNQQHRYGNGSNRGGFLSTSLQNGSGMKVVFLGETGSKNGSSGGTGVFIPHATNNLPDPQPRKKPDSMLHELVPRLSPLRFKDLPIFKETMDDTWKLIDIGSNLKTFSAIILNTIDCLEQSSLLQLRQHYKVPVFRIGPLCKLAPTLSTSFLEEETSCIAWLNEQPDNSVLYVSKGSLAISDERELTETFWGLANSDQPFLWVVRPGSVSGSEWTEVLPKGFKDIVGERGLIVKWAPQKEVLAQSAVGGFWSHCGWNSTVESLSEGVPMISSPQFLDQKVTARYLTYVWKVGLEMDGVLGRGDIESSIRRLMTGREGDEMRQRAIKLKQMIDVCILEGGSSHNSLNDLTEFLLMKNLPTQ